MSNGPTGRSPTVGRAPPPSVQQAAADDGDGDGETETEADATDGIGTSPPAGTTPPGGRGGTDEPSEPDTDQPDGDGGLGTSPPAGTEPPGGRGGTDEPTDPEPDAPAPEPPTDQPPTSADDGLRDNPVLRQQQREVASQSDAIDPSDVRFGRSEARGVYPTVPEDTLRQNLREDVAGESEALDPADVTVERTDGAFRAFVPEATAEAAQDAQIAEETAAQYEGVEASDLAVERTETGIGTSPAAGQAPPGGTAPDAISVEPTTDEARLAIAAEQSGFEQDAISIDDGEVVVDQEAAARREAGVDSGAELWTPPSADEPPTDAELATDVATGGQRTERSPDTTGGTPGVLDAAGSLTLDQLEAGFESLGEEGRAAIDTETAERVAGTETFVPEGVVTGLREAGAFVARGAGEDVGGAAGEFQEAGGLEGLGETAAETTTEQFSTPIEVGLYAAEAADVPGTQATRERFQTTEEQIAEPAIAGAAGGAPAAIAEAPGELALLSRRGAQAGEVVVENPGRAPEVAETAIGYGGVAAEATAQQFEEAPVRTSATFGTLIAGGAAVGAATSRAVAPRVRTDAGDAPSSRSGITGYAASELDPRVTMVGDFRGVGSTVARGARDRAGDVTQRVVDALSSPRDIVGDERGQLQIPRPLRDDDGPMTGEDVADPVGPPRQQAPPRERSTGRREQSRRPGIGDEGERRRLPTSRGGRTPAQRRTRRAQQAEVTQDDPFVGAPEVRGAAAADLAGEIGRVEAAQRPEATALESLGFAQGLGTEPALSTDTDVTQDVRQATRLGTRVDVQQDRDLDFDTPLDPDPDPDPDPERDLDPDPDRPFDPDPDRDRDFDLPELRDDDRDEDRPQLPGEAAEERTADFVDPFTGEF